MDINKIKQLVGGQTGKNPKPKCSRCSNEATAIERDEFVCDEHMSELEKVSDERLENLISRAEYEKPRLVIWDERDEERLLIAKELRKLRKSDSEALVRELATAVKESTLQLEYLNEKFTGTGTTEALLPRLYRLINTDSVRRILEAK